MLFRWLRNRRRNIFRFHDGIRNRAIDPLVAWRIMWEHPECNPEVDFEPAVGLAPDGSRVKFDNGAQDRVLKMAREMFGLKPYSEGSPGLTVAETIELLWSFLAYMRSLKKKPDQSPMTSAPLASESTPTSTTPQESVSFSTGTGSINDAPLSSSKRSVRL